MIDVRRFGPGERIVFLPYSQEMFDKTQKWMHERNLFDVGPEVGEHRRINTLSVAGETVKRVAAVCHRRLSDQADTSDALVNARRT